ncbi:MAG: hypothetical protein OQJ97_10620 [Rhodospirillales bacterium]|nr:hypothetical protein [Rhodospirillales bacterium]
MLIIAAFLIIAVSLMHSILGEKRLITPLLRMEGLPVILGSLQNTKLTLRAAWHLTSLLWWGIATQMVFLHFSPDLNGTAFLWMVSIVFGISALVALIGSKGAHLSWVFFMPVSLIAGYMA